MEWYRTGKRRLHTDQGLDVVDPPPGFHCRPQTSLLHSGAAWVPVLARDEQPYRDGGLPHPVGRKAPSVTPVRHRVKEQSNEGDMSWSCARRDVQAETEGVM